jgi:hypothetical protein
MSANWSAMDSDQFEDPFLAEDGSIFSADFPTAGVFILEPRPGTAEGLDEGACSCDR